MIFIDNNRNTISLCFFAFVLYQFVNFLYFPAEITFGDEGRFIQEAVKLSKTGEFWTFDLSRAWEMPLTAILFSLIYDVVQNEVGLIYSVRVIQSLLLIIQAFLIGKTSLIIFNDKISANIAFLTMLFYPFFIFYQGLLLSENTFITLLIASFYYLFLWYSHGFKLDKYFVLTNLLFSLSIYSKATLSFAHPIIIVMFYLFNKFNINKSLRIFIVSIILSSSFLTPWWIRNYIIFDAFVPFTTSSSKNLYLGNNLNNKTGGNDMNIDWEHEFTKTVNNSDYTELERSDIFKDRAINFIENHPKMVLDLMYLKFKRFYNIFPNSPSFNIGYYRYISALSYGTVFFIFVISVFYNIKYFHILVPIYLLFFYFTLLHTVFIASIRYRLPLEPFMILIASQYVSQIYNKTLNNQ